MTKEALSRREFLERLGILGGLGALYYGMTNFGLQSTAQAGDFFSFISGWMEGAVRSAELALERIAHLVKSDCNFLLQLL